MRQTALLDRHQRPSHLPAPPNYGALGGYGAQMGSPIEVLFEVSSEATIPAYQSVEAAGMDLCAAESVSLEPGERCVVGTGLRVVIPPGYEGQVRARSGLAARHGIGMVNAPGTIDADYRGEIRVILINWGHVAVKLSKGERIAQLVIAPIVRAMVRQVDAVAEYPTQRGEGGFGSTGK